MSLTGFVKIVDDWRRLHGQFGTSSLASFFSGRRVGAVGDIDPEAHRQASPLILLCKLYQKDDGFPRYCSMFTRDSALVLTPGDAIEVKVTDTRAPRKESKEVARIFRVSPRQTQDNPWPTVKDQYWVGGIYRGIVTGTADTGSWIDLGSGIDAMAPHPRDRVLSNGDGVLIQISSIEPGRERVSGTIAKVLRDQVS